MSLIGTDRADEACSLRLPASESKAVGIDHGIGAARELPSGRVGINGLGIGGFAEDWWPGDLLTSLCPAIVVPLLKTFALLLLLAS
jgi:hypothetical protein